MSLVTRRSALLLLGASVAPPVRAAGAAADPAPSPELVDALTWGVNGSTMAAAAEQGRERWLHGQLHPAPGERLPKAAQQQVDALAAGKRSALQAAADFDGMARIAGGMVDPEPRAAAQAAYQSAMSDYARQAAAISIWRALYSPDQLRERMTWFWVNHFNVHQYKGNVRVLLADYEGRAIRPRALGRFRDLLLATLRHPAMLRYLDNADNAAGHPNENYAREIMELHTMGVGSGYTQADVEQLARILSGAGIDLNPAAPALKPEWQGLLVRDGAFEFNPARHDFEPKTLLGHRIEPSGYGEIEQAADILCGHPATARHVARRLALYFVADDPAGALVERMAAAFTRTGGDIAATLEAMIGAPEFAASLGTRFKDPVRWVLSAVRLAYDDRVILNTGPIQGWLNRLAEGLYNHQTPDGYPLESSAWSGSGQMLTRFEIARQIGSGSAGLFKPPGSGAAEEPAFPLLQNGLYFSALQSRLSAQTRAALGRAISPQDWNTLLLSSPEFML